MKNIFELPHVSQFFYITLSLIFSWLWGQLPVKTAVNTGLCEGSRLGMSGAVPLIPLFILVVL
jgi:hypothetical protein